MTTTPDNQLPSAGKQIAIAGMASTQGVTLLMFVCSKLELTGVTPEVAGAMIGVATAVAGALVHEVQRSRERKQRERSES